MLRSPSLVLALAGALYSETLPADPAELSARAAVAYRSGRITETRHLYESALAEQPRYGRALAGLGRIDAAEHRRIQAEQNLARADQSHPQDPIVVKEYAAAVGHPSLEAVLLRRLINLPATPPDMRLYVQWRLTRQQHLAGRIVNQLRSPYQPYQLSMPVARADSFRPHGWFLRVSLNGRPPGPRSAG